MGKEPQLLEVSLLHENLSLFSKTFGEKFLMLLIAAALVCAATVYNYLFWRSYEFSH